MSFLLIFLFTQVSFHRLFLVIYLFRCSGRIFLIIKLFFAQVDERFFAECERELTKINLFFSQKIAESQGKVHELESELTQFKVNCDFFLLLFYLSKSIS